MQGGALAVRADGQDRRRGRRLVGALNHRAVDPETAVEIEDEVALLVVAEAGHGRGPRAELGCVHDRSGGGAGGVQADFLDEFDAAAVRDLAHRPPGNVEDRQPDKDRIEFRHVRPSLTQSARKASEV